MINKKKIQSKKLKGYGWKELKVFISECENN